MKKCFYMILFLASIVRIHAQDLQQHFKHVVEDSVFALNPDVVYVPALNATIAISSLEAGKRPVALEISKELIRQLSLP